MKNTKISVKNLNLYYGENGETKQIFSYPKDKRTEDYITGRFG